MTVEGSDTSDTDAAKLDPVSDFCLRLAEAQNGAGYTEDAWWSVLITLADTSIDTFAQATKAFSDDMLIPVAYDQADRAAVMTMQPVTIFARAAVVKALNTPDNPYKVVGLQLGSTVPEAKLDFNASFPEQGTIDVAADAVVIAIIDEGIGIAHDLLRKGREQTRVECATVFEASPVPGGTSSYGRELDKGAIDQLLADCTFNALLDEDLFYARAGILDWTAGTTSTVAHRVSHGTHITAIAAGHDMQAARADRPVICASLPPRLVADTTGVDALPTLYLAFHILAAQARRFRLPDGTPAPVVYNFSFGNAGGPHDGTGPFATLFEYYFGPDSVWSPDAQKAWLTLPAGNTNLLRLHGVADAVGETTFDLSVQPDDRTPSVVQIWMPTVPDGQSAEVADIRVTTPAGESVTIQTVAGQSASLLNSAGVEIARLACQHVAAPTDRTLATLSIVPTAGLTGNGPLAPIGTWKVSVTRDTTASADPINLWIRRDETLPGTRSGGRQAWFSNDNYVRFDQFGAPLAVDPVGTTSPVRRAGSLSGFAAGATPIVVAAYTQRSAEMSLYSSAGPVADRTEPPLPQRNGPDLTAKGDDSFVRQGVISAGSRSGSWVRLSGTSVAAPRVARTAASGIHAAAGPGRDWSHAAAAASPFPLTGNPSPERAGVGGIEIPIPGVRSG